jgi:NAD-dependent histone deacetylase SIR2
MGTSLVVNPFASLIHKVPADCPRVLINMEPAGDIGDLKNDVLLLGKCDDIVHRLAEALGWRDDLQRAWDSTMHVVQTGEEQTTPSEAIIPGAGLKDEVDKLTEAVDTALHLDEKTEESTFAPSTSAVV